MSSGASFTDEVGGGNGMSFDGRLGFLGDHGNIFYGVGDDYII